MDIGVGKYWMSNGKWKHYMKRYRLCKIPAQIVRQSQTQALCVWSNRWALISERFRRLLDSRWWRQRRNYRSLLSPIDTTIRRRLLLSIVNHQLVPFKPLSTALTNGLPSSFTWHSWTWSAPSTSVARLAKLQDRKNHSDQVIRSRYY